MKRYECLTCGTKQKFANNRIVSRKREGHMTYSTHGKCAKCNSIEPMVPMEKMV